MMRTPRAATTNPPFLSWLFSRLSANIAARFIPCGAIAQTIPSRTKTRASAVASSNIDKMTNPCSVHGKITQNSGQFLGYFPANENRQRLEPSVRSMIGAMKAGQMMSSEPWSHRSVVTKEKPVPRCHDIIRTRDGSFFFTKNALEGAATTRRELEPAPAIVRVSGQHLPGVGHLRHLQPLIR